MKRNLLFLAPFPDERYPKDGMISRISSIDKHFIDSERTYLYVSLRKNINPYYKKLQNLEVVELNLFIHFFRILRIFYSAKIIYSHSVHMLRNTWFLLPFFKGRFILDAHGVVPEEIRYFESKNFMYYTAYMAEKMIFLHKNATIICVTNAMKNHFAQKYKDYRGEFKVYGIFPENLNVENLNEIEEKEVSNQITVLYSGSSSGWQNIDLMLELIEKNQQPNVYYIILTAEVETFQTKIAKYQINKDRLLIKSVSPGELFAYYTKADYGFILRDDQIVNRVANPTKLIEYLYFGVIPIVKCPYIGDYYDYGYEYLPMQKFDESIHKPLIKSQKNKAIALKLKKNNIESDIKKIVTG